MRANAEPLQFPGPSLILATPIPIWNGRSVGSDAPHSDERVKQDSSTFPVGNGFRSDSESPTEAY
jgi:hypothetical protein